MRGGGAPARAGIGLRAPHVAEIAATRPDLGWLEVHAENYMSGTPAVRRLEALRRDYPLSLHGVGLSLGSVHGLDAAHLGRLRDLADRLAPCLLSEHLSWSVADGAYLNHLVPLPYTEESLAIVAANLERAQDRLGRRVLVENPASYLRFAHSSIPEAEFLAELTRRTGCGVLCDVNNLFVSAANVGLPSLAYLDALPADAVCEIHLAGHAENDTDGITVLIDDHGSRVRAGVWALYEAALSRFGPVPTLIEWDTDIPALAVLLDEAAAADRRLSAPLYAHAG
jgi:uncharacterized protein